jgi:transposase
MNSMHYIGFDIHKKTISFCEKQTDGTVVDHGVLRATRQSLVKWVENRKAPWQGAMEATLFTGWVYDHLLPYAAELFVAHPAMLKAISAAKKKNDAADAEMIADLLRCDLLPLCYMAPEEHRNLRRVLRYRNFLVCEAIRMKNKTSGLLMEVGAEHSKARLHGKKYFNDLLGGLDYIPESVVDLLKITRSNLEIFTRMQKSLLHALRGNPLIRQRVELLMTIPGVGEVTALTWVLEIGDVHRFNRISKAVSYCGLCSAQKQSAGKNQRGPISKQRNKHLQTVLVEAAKLAPRWNRQLAAVHEREIAKGNRNRATLAVARKLVSYMLVVDKSEQPFTPREVLEKAA